MTQDNKNLNICYIFPSAMPSKNASSLQTAKMADAFSMLSNLIIFLPNTGMKNTSIKKFYNLKNNFKIFRLKNFTSFPVGLNYYLFSIISILKSFKFKPNFYITRIFIASFFLCILRKKHIFEIHNDMSIEGRLVKLIFKHLNIFNSKYVIKIVTTTQTLKDHYIKNYNIKRDKIYVLSNSSDLKNINLNIKKKIKNVGYFGSIYKSRGIEKILFLSRAFQHLDFFIYGGDGSEVHKLRQKYSEKNIFFHSYIDQKKLEQKINEMDILLLPYTNKITVAGDVGDIFNYTSPLKMFDYLAAGKIIIASEIKVLKEILRNNYNCVFVKNYLNNFAWKLKFHQVLSNQNINRNIILNSINFSKKNNTKLRAKKFISFYKNEI